MSVSEAIHGLRQRVEVLERRVNWYRTRLRNLKEQHKRANQERFALRRVAAKIHELRMEHVHAERIVELTDLLNELEKAAGLE